MKKLKKVNGFTLVDYVLANLLLVALASVVIFTICSICYFSI